MHNPCIYVCLARGQAIFSSQLLLALYLHKSRDIVILKGSRAYRNPLQLQQAASACTSIFYILEGIAKYFESYCQQQ